MDKNFLLLSPPALRLRWAMGMDCIYTIILKHLSLKAFDLLMICIELWLNNLVPDSWKYFRVIPIVKSSLLTCSYRSIALSLPLYKLTVFIIIK